MAPPGRGGILVASSRDKRDPLSEGFLTEADMSSSIATLRPALSLALVALLAPTLALAGWQPGGVTVHATASMLSPLSASGDGGFGTFVVWQENASGAAGVLRA